MSRAKLQQDGRQDRVKDDQITYESVNADDWSRVAGWDTNKDTFWSRESNYSESLDVFLAQAYLSYSDVYGSFKF